MKRIKEDSLFFNIVKLLMLVFILIFMKILLAGISAGSLGKNKGCEKAPGVIAGLVKGGLANEAGNDLMMEIKELKFNGNIDEFYNEIAGEKFDVMIGGDHSISYGGVKGLKGGKCLIVFDAHPDVEAGTESADHECWVRKLIEENIVNKSSVFLIGLRAFSKSELRFLRENRIRYLMMKQIFELGVQEVCDDVMEFANGFESVYLSVDIDVVEPGAAPGTGYLEPGGLSAREIIYFIQRLKMLKNLKRVDIVEVNPDKDFNEMTCKLAAKLVGELG